MTGGHSLGGAHGHIKAHGLSLSYSYAKGTLYWRVIGPTCLRYARENTAVLLLDVRVVPSSFFVHTHTHTQHTQHTHMHTHQQLLASSQADLSLSVQLFWALLRLQLPISLWAPGQRFSLLHCLWQPIPQPDGVQAGCSIFLFHWFGILLSSVFQLFPAW